MLLGAQTLGLQCHGDCAAVACWSVPRDLPRGEQCCFHIYLLASLVHLGNWRVHNCSAALDWGQSPSAVAGQGEVGDKKGWETVKDIFTLASSVDDRRTWVSGGLGRFLSIS